MGAEAVALLDNAFIEGRPDGPRTQMSILRAQGWKMAVQNVCGRPDVVRSMLQGCSSVSSIPSS